MRIDRDAAAIVVHSDIAIGIEFNLDPAGMTGHSLIHRIVEDLGKQMMISALIGATDIHARALAHRLKTFKDFNVLG